MATRASEIGAAQSKQQARDGDRRDRGDRAGHRHGDERMHAREHGQREHAVAAKSHPRLLADGNKA